VSALVSLPRLRRLGLAVLLAAGAPNFASAADPIGWYVGGAFGQAEVITEVSSPALPSPAQFHQTHSAFKLMVGVHPISLLGAEVSYIDFAKPEGQFLGYPASASMRAASAFGMIYFPVPVIDLYLKAGVARIWSTVSGFAPVVCIAPGPCSPVPVEESQTHTGFGAGAGVQFKFGSWATRAEYERFDASGEKPYVWSLGLTWSF
jgi:opacity protein-like surface antigen